VGKSLISSYKTTIALLAVYASGLAIATFVEKYVGTEAAKVFIYHSPLFFVLQFFLVVNFVASSLQHQLFRKKKWGFLVIHFSLIIMLAGALWTHIAGKEGMVHLREGESLDYMTVRTNRGESSLQLPFRLELISFTVERYPGSSSPSNFESLIRIRDGNQSFERKISMNNVLDYKGYRFFQASFDSDEKGTILSVNRDVAGRNITYTGYALLITGFILSFTNKNSRFRQLARRLLFLTVFLIPLKAQAGSAEDISRFLLRNAVNAEHAADFGALPLQSLDGRIEPVGTFSSEILRKLHHSDKIGNLNSDRFLLSLLAMPEMWMQVPVIALKNEQIAKQYGLTSGYCAYIQLFEIDGAYKLQNDLETVYAKSPSERSRFDKDLIKLDEQVNVFYQLVTGQMLNIFPDPDAPNHKWSASNDLLNSYLSDILTGLKTGDWTPAGQSLEAIRNYQKKNTTLRIDNQKLKAELLYNRLKIFQQCKKVYLILGGILLVLSFIALFRKNKWLKTGIISLTMLVSIALLYHFSGIALRWYIAGYAPWSNAYETMVYVAFVTVIAGLFFVRQSSITFALASLFGGIILFVSGLNWMDPQISPLIPVLKSPWLMIHVAVIVAAYGFFGIGFLLGLTNLGISAIVGDNPQSPANKLSIINEMALLLGLALMTTGTFIGAVWANESWGRYWGWDPKETWALVTVVVYTIVLHVRLVKKWDKPVVLNALAVLAFASVLMTYFGVNYFLSGMHSYGR
jgi:cytochrome c-type biogenesis protein CcsB